MTKPTLTDAEVDDIIRAAMADEGCAPVPDWMDRAIYRAGYERGYAAGLAAGVLREQRRKMDCRNASGCLYTLNQCAEVGYCIRAAPRAQAGSTGGEEMACRAVLDSVAGELADLPLPGEHPQRVAHGRGGPDGDVPAARLRFEPAEGGDRCHVSLRAASWGWSTGRRRRC